MRWIINKAVEDAYWLVSNDTKFVRLTTLTTIIHSIIFLLYVGVSAWRVFASSSTNSKWLWDLLQSIEWLFTSSGVFGRAIWIGIILAIGYFIMPPIWEASLIYYLSAQEKRWSASLGKWFSQFFPMFEYHGLISFFTLLPFFIVLSRFWTLDLLGNVLVIIIMVLWWLVILFAWIFLPFTKYYIVIEDLKPFDAMKKSMSLALENLWTSTRTALLQYALSIRFIINILLFLWLPLLILYIATAFDITQWWPIAMIIIIVSIIVWLLTAYVNWIIEAFFITLRYRLFVEIRS
jgi:hypothetical protein